MFVFCDCDDRSSKAVRERSSTASKRIIRMRASDNDQFAHFSSVAVASSREKKSNTECAVSPGAKLIIRQKVSANLENVWSSGGELR